MKWSAIDNNLFIGSMHKFFAELKMQFKLQEFLVDFAYEAISDNFFLMST